MKLFEIIMEYILNVMELVNRGITLKILAAYLISLVSAASGQKVNDNVSTKTSPQHVTKKFK